VLINNNIDSSSNLTSRISRNDDLRVLTPKFGTPKKIAKNIQFDPHMLHPPKRRGKDKIWRKKFPFSGYHYHIEWLCLSATIDLASNFHLHTITMSSEGEDFNEENTSGLPQNQKRRRIQRACDICRRKKSVSVSIGCLATDLSFVIFSPMYANKWPLLDISSLIFHQATESKCPEIDV